MRGKLAGTGILTPGPSYTLFSSSQRHLHYRIKPPRGPRLAWPFQDARTLGGLLAAILALTGNPVFKNFHISDQRILIHFLDPIHGSAQDDWNTALDSYYLDLFEML